MIEDP